MCDYLNYQTPKELAKEDKDKPLSSQHQEMTLHFILN